MAGGLFRYATLHPFLAPEGRAAGPRLEELSFQAHIDLLQFFLAHRDRIVERIEGLLNAQRKPLEYLQDGPLLSRLFEDCFFTGAQVTQEQWRLRGQLEEAHWAGGFKPRELAGLNNGLLDPAEMMIRAFHLWRHARWPGRNGRLRYAHTLYHLYMIRSLELSSMRLWDAGSGDAGGRLAQVQGVLDRLWNIRSADQPVLVRDARWLIQMAQSPATEELAPYFEVAKNIEALPPADRIEVHKAGVRLAAGHLRSQIRYYCVKKGVSLDDHSLILITRNTNALDFALLVQDLVPLLAAYEAALHQNDAAKRLELADVICQGVSPDPELFLNRVELLGAYSMIEHLFVTTDGDGEIVHTPMGQRHVELLRQYAALSGRLAKPLFEDCARFRPIAGAYSPYGILYGFASDLFGHMVLSTLLPGTVTRFSVEDVFTGEEGDTAKLAWVSGWRNLPHLAPEVKQLFDYPQQFAEDVFRRIESALRSAAGEREADAAAGTGRMFILPAGTAQRDSNEAQIPDLPVRYIRSSDAQIVSAHEAEQYDELQLLSDRREGKCVITYKTPGGWVCITKSMLTEVLGARRDVKVMGLPASAAQALKLMYPDLVAASGR